MSTRVSREAITTPRGAGRKTLAKMFADNSFMELQVVRPTKTWKEIKIDYEEGKQFDDGFPKKRIPIKAKNKDFPKDPKEPDDLTMIENQ